LNVTLSPSYILLLLVAQCYRVFGKRYETGIYRLIGGI
jgi:hypothetical protein